MIDHFALALGHGLLVIVMWRLMLRPGLDDDPLIGTIAAEADEARRRTSASGRSAARRARTADDGAAQDEHR